MTISGQVYVDHTHCGRHVTGLERITLELFSREALAPVEVEIVASSGVRDMVLRQTFALPARLAADRRAILLCPGFPPSPLATLFGARVLPYVHDTFLITRPGDLNRRAKIYMAPAFRLALVRLPRFLVNSETTRDDLRRFCQPDADIRLYRPAVRNVFDLSPGDRAARAESPGALRLVALGTVEPRKNLLTAAAIVARLRETGFPQASLDIVGRPGWGDDADKLARAPGVTMRGYQPVEAVRAIVGSADMLISTSHDEGLGLPLLEAQYAGLPVVAPDKPVFREVLGESGAFVDPADPVRAAQRIAALVAEPGWRARAVAAAAANLERWLALAGRDHGDVVELLQSLTCSKR
jgi:glycosyltransferase involved in cell wall biosynthesis